MASRKKERNQLILRDLRRATVRHAARIAAWRYTGKQKESACFAFLAPSLGSLVAARARGRSTSARAGGVDPAEFLFFSPHAPEAFWIAPTQRVRTATSV